MRHKYWIIWTYIANYGKQVFMAESPEKAAEMLLYCFSKDFKEKGTMYVFDHDPVLVIVKGEKVNLDA